MGWGRGFAAGLHPPFSFRLAEKKTGRARSKRKDAGSQTLRCQRKVWLRRGSCGSVRQVSEAPSTLRRTGPAESCVPAQTPRRSSGWKTELAYFYTRAFRFTRKGYAASVGRQSRQRLRSRCALAGRWGTGFLLSGFTVPRVLPETTGVFLHQQAFSVGDWAEDGPSSVRPAASHLPPEEGFWGVPGLPCKGRKWADTEICS